MSKLAPGEYGSTANHFTKKWKQQAASVLIPKKSQSCPVVHFGHKKSCQAHWYMHTKNWNVKWLNVCLRDWLDWSAMLFCTEKAQDRYEIHVRSISLYFQPIKWSGPSAHSSFHFKTLAHEIDSWTTACTDDSSSRQMANHLWGNLRTLKIKDFCNQEKPGGWGDTTVTVAWLAEKNQC